MRGSLPFPRGASGDGSLAGGRNIHRRAAASRHALQQHNALCGPLCRDMGVLLVNSVETVVERQEGVPTMPNSPCRFDPINITMKKQRVSLPAGILAEIDRRVAESNEKDELLSLSRTRFIVLSVGYALASLRDDDLESSELDSLPGCEQIRATNGWNGQHLVIEHIAAKV
jgi:hypothetical protein